MRTLFHLCTAALALAAGTVHAHGGGLDRHGCHHDRKNGGYHCHRASAAAPPARPSPQRLAPARIDSSPVPASRGAFRNCAEARAAGAAPVRRGDPGYAPHLDRDDDGIGCEPYRGR
ncbi:excalibur calcium-binding domain-containing protein [Luteimonas yindakuii]|uniref:excalibur calcium-binding domain-containing protein n=1 Tax=Luteimonas yindakuii TaxID=2565782 RepID=UPI0011079FA5|nr:excalibur calcium-binding domain-containing protein [Luteimonas yindakuii]QCO68526.2 excalibur calcium-binding domain-containing protein [Luteimonas yindakuii]